MSHVFISFSSPVHLTACSWSLLSVSDWTGLTRVRLLDLMNVVCVASSGGGCAGFLGLLAVLVLVLLIVGMLVEKNDNALN